MGVPLGRGERLVPEQGLHVTDEMRRRLCGFLEQLWQEAVAQRYELAPRSAVPLLNEILIAHGRDRTGPAGKPAPQNAPQEG